jgi:hypothetical protein
VRVYSTLGPPAGADKLGTDHQRQHLDSAEAEGELEAKKNKTNGMFMTHEHLEFEVTCVCRLLLAIIRVIAVFLP